jgi:hypothetical protein
MVGFVDWVIAPHVKKSSYKSLCEIGSSDGAASDRLLDLTQVKISIIDPCLDEDLCKKYEHNDRVKVHRGLSLEVLPKLSEKFDCILIDGDHNWFTVFNELDIIDKKGLLKKGGTIFFHDVCWPYGRRDMYYLPDSIPIEFRCPYAKKGIVRGQSKLSDVAGMNNGLNNALFEGGERNGVLTAIEDFIIQHKYKYMFFYYEQEFGLGVLWKKDWFKINMSFFIMMLKETLSNKYPTLYSWLKRGYILLVKNKTVSRKRNSGV